jgi:two-component system response regulator HydG
MLAHSWPGNVRELHNAIERAILLCDGGLITREHLPAPLPRFEDDASAAVRDPHPADGPEALDLEVVERGLVEKALKRAKGNKSQAARLLGLTRAQLYWRLEKYGVTGGTPAPEIGATGPQA